MGTTLLWVLQLAFALLLLAAALAWGSGRSPRARRLAIALALAPVLAFHALLAWKALALRFDVGVLHSPWRMAASLLAAHVLGAALLLVRARRERGAATWPTGSLALCALVALALDGTTLWNLELAARLRVADLRLEAGQIAWREGPPRPAPGDNAAPLYLSAAQAFEGRAETDLDAWRPALRGGEHLDTEDPALRAALEALAPNLQAVREATRLPACWFEPEPGLDGTDALVGVPLPRLSPVFLLADGLALEARLRAADGDTAGALEDVGAIFALSDHLPRTPMLIPLMMASAIREVGLTTLTHVLAAEGLQAAGLEGFELRGRPALAAVLPRALAMEEAYGLSAVGLLARGDIGFADVAGWSLASRLNAALYKVFLLEDDVAGYRLSARELQELARMPLAALRAVPELDPDEIRSRGVLASLLVPSVRGATLALHRADARVELAQLALAAARYRLEHGAYPTTLAELGVEAPGVELEGDGSYLRLVRPDLADGERQVDLRLPPRVE